MLYTTLISCVLLILVFYQDLKYRGVSWYLFPALALLMLWKGLMEFSAPVYLQSVGINLGLMLLQLGLFYLVSLRFLKAGSKFTELLGPGDLLFFVIMAMGIGYELFPILFTASLILSLLVSFLFFKGKTIPLAGLQAVFLAVCIPIGV